MLHKGERREEKTEGVGEERRIKETDTDMREIEYIIYFGQQLLHVAFRTTTISF